MTRAGENCPELAAHKPRAEYADPHAISPSRVFLRAFIRERRATVGMRPWVWRRRKHHAEAKIWKERIGSFGDRLWGDGAHARLRPSNRQRPRDRADQGRI